LPLAAAFGTTPKGSVSTNYFNSWQCVVGPRSSTNLSASLIAPPRDFMVFSPTAGGGSTFISIVLCNHNGINVSISIGGSSVAVTHILCFTPVHEW
jgi:hypothetical protein